jgi:hypothetical protein
MSIAIDQQNLVGAMLAYMLQLKDIEARDCHFEQALQVDRLPTALCSHTPGSLPAT